MKPIKEHLKNKILNDCRVIITATNKSIQELQYTEWYPKFEEMMREHLIIGALRYGDMDSENFYEYIQDCYKRLRLYEQTGNIMYLVDVANFCMLEAKKGLHPNKHYKQEDDDIHVERIK